MATKEKITYESDIEDVVRSSHGAVSGNVAVFGSGVTVEDSGLRASDIVLESEVDQKVSEAASSIWDAVRGEHALGAYGSDAWEPRHDYYAGDYCMIGDTGYMCRQDHESGDSFDLSKWDVVLTPEGKSAVESALSAYSNEGMAALADIAPSFDENEEYKVNQLVVVGGSLKICTSAGTGTEAAFESSATVEESIERRLAELSIPDSVGDLENDVGYLLEEALENEFDASDGGYSVGEACTHGGRFYICISPVSEGGEWNQGEWSQATFSSYINGILDSKASASDVNAALEGKADKSEVESELARKVGIDNLPYKILNVPETVQADPTKAKFNVYDRAVNVVQKVISGNINKIVLVPPGSAVGQVQGGDKLSRDFYVVLMVESETTGNVEMSGASLKDYDGNDVTMSYGAWSSGSMSVYRFTEMSVSGSVFIVTCVGDAAYRMVKEIESAIDEILEGSGVTPEFKKGVFVEDENGKYHKLTAVYDPELGQYDLGIEQEGIDPMSSGTDTEQLTDVESSDS